MTHRLDRKSITTWLVLPIILSALLGTVVIAFAVDWSNQSFQITDPNGNTVNWATGSGIIIHNFTVTPTHVLFSPTVDNEFRWWNFLDARRDFDVTLTFVNATQADFFLHSGTGGARAANVELLLNGTIIDGWELNGVQQFVVFSFDDPNCVFNPPDDDILKCTGINNIDIGDVSGDPTITVFINNTRSVSPDDLIEIGKRTEPNNKQDYPPLDVQIFISFLEWFEPSNSALSQIQFEIDGNRTNVYEILDRCQRNQYGNEQPIKDGCREYERIYVREQNMTQFFNSLEPDIRSLFGLD